MSKHVPSAKSTSRMPRDVPNKPMGPAGGEGLLRLHFAVCVWRCACCGGARGVRCVLWGQRQHSRAPCFFTRRLGPFHLMSSITQISSSLLRFFCACSGGDMTTPTAIAWRTVFKKPENCLHFSMEHVSFSFNARATEFSSHRRIWFLTAISLLNLFVLVFLSSFFIQCIWTVF